jgi:ABC-type bacteriocin/lantibiotic exporter with double-glycine peptidase domain
MESTSAIDKRTQDKIIENILDKYKNKIVIFITHDHLILKKLDEIIDLEKF